MSSLFFRQWRVFALLVGIIVVTGLSSLSSIGRQEDPYITNIFATIITPLPGAGPARVEALVTEKIEDELREIAEIDEINSTSRRGISVVGVKLSQYISDAEIETAWSEIRDALSDARRNFPPGTPEPQFQNDRFGAFTAILALSMEDGADFRPSVLRRYGEMLQDRLRQMGGTKRAFIYGDTPEEVLVEVDAEKLAQIGMTPVDVSNAILAGDAKVRAGQLRNQDNNLLIEVDGEILTLERLRDLPLRTGANGTVLRLRDVANISRTVERPQDSIAYLGRDQAVFVAAEMETGLQVDAWIARVDALYDDFDALLPQEVLITKVFDQSEYTFERLNTLVTNLGIGVLLVVIVLFFTLGWRGAVIVGCILPLTTLMSITVMQFVGLPIHQMSVAGLIVALGLLVDAAIVMTDEVRRRLAGKMSRQRSVEDAVKRLAVPLLASTITTVLAFMPMVLLPGPPGDFVGSIALAVIIMLMSSLFLALTITPALAGWVLPKRGLEDGAAWWVSGINTPRLGRWFAQSLDWTLSHRRVGIFAALSLPLIGFMAFPTLTEQFFPGVVRDQFYIDVSLENTASIDRTEAVALEIHQLLEADEGIDTINWVIGKNAPAFYYNMRFNKDGVDSYAQALVTTRDKYSTNAIVSRTQNLLDDRFPDVQIIVRGLTQGPPVAAPVEVRIIGPNLNMLRDLGAQVRQRMSQSPYFLHTNASLLPAPPKLRFELDENKVRLAGLTLAQVAQFLDAALEGVTGGSLLEATEELPVRVRFSAGQQAAANVVRTLRIPAPSGNNRSIPLSALGELVLVASESPIPRFQGERQNLVQGFIPVDVLPQEAFDSFVAALEANPVQLPNGYRIEYGGDSDARADTVGNLMTSLGLIGTLTIATIVLTFNSFRLSMIAGIVAVLSMGMSLLALEIADYPFGVNALIGVIGSIGVSINAAIIIMTALQASPAAMQGDTAAVRDVVMASSRHIISTTITTFGGFLPLILEGGGFWPPFAMAIAGGVLLSTVVSFYFTPPAFLMVIRRTQAETDAGVEAVEADQPDAKVDTSSPTLKAV